MKEEVGKGEECAVKLSQSEEVVKVGRWGYKAQFQPHA